MIKKGSKLFSILKFKCPHCHEGDFFKCRNPYRLKQAGDIYEKCLQCGKKNSKEPGFYFGAMFVSYGLGVASFVSIFIAVYLLFPETEFLDYIIIITVSILLLGPLLYALSKIIWANMFFNYSEKDS